MTDHFSDFIVEEFRHGKRLNLLYLDGAAKHAAVPSDVKSRVNSVTDWENINMAFRRMDR